MVYDAFNLLSSALRRRIKEFGYIEPTEPQQEAIPRVLRGENVLLIAPTGTGKTEAALFPIFDMLIKGKGLRRPVGISVIYITPLRALNRDIFRRMERLAEALGIRVEVRHGDTAASIRRRQALSPPDMLITTPETFQAILPGKVMRRHLRSVRWVVVDEIHELIADKRGAQLSIGLERLREVTGSEFQRIGLSATIGSHDYVKSFLSGVGRDASLVYVPVAKALRIVVDVAKPSSDDFKKAEGLKASPDIIARIGRISELLKKHRSVLIFTNTREMAELLASRFRLLDKEVGVGVHHGSLSLEERVKVEGEFKEERLKAVVCTSSLELGMDIGTVDLVVQYMSPRQVTRLIQRVGRSGHKIGEVSRGYIIPSLLDDVCESFIISRRALKEKLEHVEAHEKALDVLAHQTAGLLLDKGGLSIDEAYKVFRRSWLYRSLGIEEFKSVINQLEAQKLIRVIGNYIQKKVAKTWSYYYENLSMIPDTKQYKAVDVLSRKPIGVLDEEFIFLYGKLGSIIILAGRPWRVIGVEEDVVMLEPVEDVLGAIPAWVGELIPVSFEVAQEVGMLRDRVLKLIERDEGQAGAFDKYVMSGEACLKVLEGLKEALVSGVPIATDRKIVVEGLGRLIVIHACFGNKVNQTLALIIASLLTSKLGMSVGIRSDPYRILLLFSRKMEPSIVKEVLEAVKLEEVEDMVNDYVMHSELYQWRLQHVAKRFGLISREASMINIRRLLYITKDTPISYEALREVLIDKLDVPKAIEVLSRIMVKEIVVEVFKASEEGCSPLAYPIIDVALPHDIIAPRKPIKTVVELLKNRLLNEEVKLVCLHCGGWSGVRKVASLEDDVKCPKCEAKFIAVTYLSDAIADRVAKSIKMGRGVPKENQEEFRRLQLSASLILAFGKKAAIAMAARGVGPQTAARIFRKPHWDEESFYLDILEAEKKYIMTRPFW